MIIVVHHWYAQWITHKKYYVYIYIHTCYVIIEHEHVQLNMIPKMHTVRNLNETPQVICHNSRLPDVGLSENSMSHNMLIPVYTQMLRDI